LHEEELRYLEYSLNITSLDEMGRHVAHVEDMRSAYKHLDAKPVGKTPLEIDTEIVCSIHILDAPS
jgi:hypothetical protein